MAIATGVIFQGMNRGGSFSGKRIPEIEVTTIPNLSRAYRVVRGSWWRRWIQNWECFRKSRVK